MSDAGDIGPWTRHRAVYFVREHRKGLERRAAAVEAARAARRRIELLERELASLRRSIDRVDVGGEPWARLVALDERLQGELRQLRQDLVHRRWATQPTHREKLVEWSVEHDHRPPPAPGEYLLARRSKKPFA